MSSVSAVLCLCLLCASQEAAAVRQPLAQARPHILWISCEDISPDLGCYGDSYAVTPAIDRLAAEGVRFDRVFSHAGVCAPTRSGIITGMYPTSIGTHHMRCQGVPPPEVRCFTEYLRAAGYYCTNNVKTDYQFAPPATAWDENSRSAHWRGREEGQPFFAVINLTTTHESRIRMPNSDARKLVAQLTERHDPNEAVLPPYYPDTPVVRRDWANYADNITAMDAQVEGILRDLEQDGLADETIVWFWGDHGRGLPRGKRWIYDSGLQVPLIIRVPPKWRARAMPDGPNAVQPGTVNDELIAFIDFAPTMLSLAGVAVPAYIQGQAFLGPQRAVPRRYVHAHRDRMDERYDLIRAVRDKRFKYIRNFMPHLTYAQNIGYMEEMPTMQEMRRLHAADQLVGPQKLFFRPTKPIEELYDTEADPHEISNLADEPAHRDTLQRLRGELTEWMKSVGDVGMIPEPEFDAWKRPGGEWAHTTAPLANVAVTRNADDKRTDDAVTVTLRCATAGASIAYAVQSGDADPAASEVRRHWRLYSEPVRLRAGGTLLAKACRLGFRDGETVVVPLQPGTSDPPKPSSSPRQVAEAGSAHWRTRLEESDLLDELHAIKRLDGEGSAAIPRYIEALDSEHNSVRYWAVVGLHRLLTDRQSIERMREAIAKLLTSESAPVTRIAAARVLCDWGEQRRAIEVLVELLSHKSDSVRLHAALALGEVGESARAALPYIQASMSDPSKYVQRVGRHTLMNLAEK
jgi:uncharacterized sulfatase